MQLRAAGILFQLAGEVMKNSSIVPLSLPAPHGSWQVQRSDVRKLELARNTVTAVEVAAGNFEKTNAQLFGRQTPAFSIMGPAAC